MRNPYWCLAIHFDYWFSVWIFGCNTISEFWSKTKLSGVYSCKGIGTEVVNLLFSPHINFRGLPDPNERFSKWYRREYISIYIMQLSINHSTETKQICTFYFTGTEAIDLFIVWSYWVYGYPGSNRFNSRVVQRKDLILAFACFWIPL